MNIDDDVRHRTRPWNRRAVSLAAPGAILVVLLVVAPEVPLVVFAGVLIAVLNSASGSWIAAHLGIRRGLGVGLFLLLSTLALAGFVTAFVPAIVEQANQFVEQLPSAIEALREYVSGVPWLDKLLAGLSPSALTSGEGGAMAAGAGALGSTLGTLGNLVIVLFIGLFGALEPDLYQRGVQAMFAPSLRRRAHEVMDAVAATLRSWLVAKLIAMAVVGVLTGFGLWLIGVPLALLLGFIAALLAFIPNLGPVIAAAPAMLLAVPSGGQTVLLVVAVFVAVQTLESYAITPVLQKRQVSLPPALVLAVQLMMGVLFGLIGLVLATPIAAVAMTLLNEVYIRDYLEEEPGPD